jgi:hypothetical protein
MVGLWSMELKMISSPAATTITAYTNCSLPRLS